MKRLVIIVSIFIASCASRSGYDQAKPEEIDFTVQGDAILSRQAVSNGMKGSNDTLKRCYMGSLQMDPSVEAEITVYFEIEGSGKVSNTQVKRSKYHSSRRELARMYLEKCLIKNISMINFPKPMGEGVVQVTYPFRFHK